MSKKFMGVPVEMKDGVAKISKRDFNKIKDDHGLVKEVRDIVEKFEKALACESAKFLGDALMEGKKKKKDLHAVTLNLGTGSDAVIFNAKDKVEHRIPGTDKVKEKYFSFSCRRKGISFDKETKAVCADYEDQVKSAFFA